MTPFEDVLRWLVENDELAVQHYERHRGSPDFRPFTRLGHMASVGGLEKCGYVWADEGRAPYIRRIPAEAYVADTTPPPDCRLPPDTVMRRTLCDGEHMPPSMRNSYMVPGPDGLRVPGGLVPMAFIMAVAP